MIVTLPIPGFVSVVGFAVLGLAGDGVKSAPGLPLGQVHLALCPVAASGKADLHLADRCHSLPSLLPPPAAVGLLPFLESFS